MSSSDSSGGQQDRSQTDSTSLGESWNSQEEKMWGCLERREEGVGVTCEGPLFIWKFLKEKLFHWEDYDKLLVCGDVPI